MSAWSVVSVSVSPPRRGAGSQDSLVLRAKAATLSWSWGSQPASGTLVFVSEDGNYPRVTAGSWMEVTLYGKTFYGICQRGPGYNAANAPVPTVEGSGGKMVEVEFVDTREYLRWDRVFCVFNKSEVEVLNGVRVKRYWHIFPADWRTNVRTYTEGPLSAAQILNAVFNFHASASPQGTVGTIWDRVYHPVQ